MTPLVGIVTICRNVLPALRRTADSVLAQLGPGDEYLVVDGDSTDGTKDYLATLEARGVRTLSEPDRGISDAMNKGARLSRATWVLHLHADDTLLPGALERLRAEAAKDDADVLCGWMLKAEPQGDVLCRTDPALLERDMTVNHPATLVRRALFERVGGFEPTLRNAMDYDFFLRAKLAGARFRIVPAALSRFAAGGQSERSTWKTLLETHEVRRRRLTRGATRSRAWLTWLWLKAEGRVWLQRAGFHGLVGWWRRHVAWPPKG